MKKLFFLFFLFCFSLIAFSQSSESHLIGGEDGPSSRAIQNFKSTPEVQGFRICIFSGSEQDARTKAKQDLELFYSTFPEINGEIVYDAPIFKVVVGACINRIEAIQLLSRVKGTFPKAFIISCTISIDDFVKNESYRADSSATDNNF